MQRFLKLALSPSETEAEKPLRLNPPVPAAAHEFSNLRLPIFAQIAAARFASGCHRWGAFGTWFRFPRMSGRGLSIKNASSTSPPQNWRTSALDRHFLNNLPTPGSVAQMAIRPNPKLESLNSRQISSSNI